MSAPAMPAAAQSLRPPRDAGAELAYLPHPAAGSSHEADASHLVRGLLRFLGEDPDREGLRDTPQRVVRALQSLTAGYEDDLTSLVNGAVFAESYSEMVLVRDVEVYSLCEHHLLPFFGRAHIAYIPNGRVIGLSKLPRIVDLFARRLQVQERLTTQIAEAVDEVLSPLGVAVVIEASHLCMMMRGVEKQHSETLTSSMRGVFLTDPGTRAEFMELVHSQRR